MNSIDSIQPYEKLYIFEIDGILDGPEFTADFLGCWVEGNYSYLFFSSDRRRRWRGFWLGGTRRCGRRP